MPDWRNIRTWSREEMLKRVARFRNLKGSDQGFTGSWSAGSCSGIQTVHRERPLILPGAP